MVYEPTPGPSKSRKYRSPAQRAHSLRLRTLSNTGSIEDTQAHSSSDKENSVEAEGNSARFTTRTTRSRALNADLQQD